MFNTSMQFSGKGEENNNNKKKGPIISLYYSMIIASVCMYLHWN